MREPRKSSIGELFTGDTHYVIPKYQRDFDWKSGSQVSDLMSDLISATDSKNNDSLYLGAMIFDVSEEKAQTTIEVIDGQQRLTTIMLLLIAMRDYARWELQEEAIAQSLQKHISNSDALSTDKNHRMSPSPVISQIFNIVCDYMWDGKFPTKIISKGQKVSLKREINRVKPIYDFCLSEIKLYTNGNKDKFRQLAKHLRDKTFIIKIEIEERSEAFEVFERTNARGKGLEVSDLLKNYIFSQEENIIEENIGDTWDDIIQSFGGSSIKALKQFWVSRAGKVNSRELYRNIKAYASDIGINNFVEELREFAAFYSAFNSDDPEAIKMWLTSVGFPKENMLIHEFRRSISVLRFFNISQALPLIFSAMRSFQKIDGDKVHAKQILTLLRTLEYFHFVNNKVCGNIGNESENAYAKFSSLVYKNENLQSLDKIRSWFENALESEQTFSANFTTLSYGSVTDRNVIRYVFDRLVNDGVKDGQSIDLLDLHSSQAGIRTSYDIEHLMPKSLAQDDNEAALYHSIGNLIVIPKQINQILSNKDFSEKMKILRKPHEFSNNIKNVPSYLQEFLDNYGDIEWSKSSIEERATKLAVEIYFVASKKMKYN